MAEHTTPQRSAAQRKAAQHSSKLPNSTAQHSTHMREGSTAQRAAQLRGQHSSEGSTAQRAAQLRGQHSTERSTFFESLATAVQKASKAGWSFPSTPASALTALFAYSAASPAYHTTSDSQRRQGWAPKPKAAVSHEWPGIDKGTGTALYS